MLILLIEDKEYIIFSNALRNGLGYATMQEDKMVANASQQVKSYERNYPTPNLKLAVVVFALKI